MNVTFLRELESTPDNRSKARRVFENQTGLQEGAGENCEFVLRPAGTQGVIWGFVSPDGVLLFTDGAA